MLVLIVERAWDLLGSPQYQIACLIVFGRFKRPGFVLVYLCSITHDWYRMRKEGQQCQRVVLLASHMIFVCTSHYLLSSVQVCTIPPKTPHKPQDLGMLEGLTWHACVADG